MTNIAIFLMAIAVTIVAALIEAKGYTISFDAYRGDQIQFGLLTASFLVYSLGIWVDYFALWIASRSHFYIPELLALIFMVSTIVGIAVISGQFFTWALVDKIVAILVVIGLGWLTWRVD